MKEHKVYNMQHDQTCPHCKKLKIGDLQSFCKHCGNSAGSDRWFSTQGESTRMWKWR